MPLSEEGRKRLSEVTSRRWREDREEMLRIAKENIAKGLTKEASAKRAITVSSDRFKAKMKPIYKKLAVLGEKNSEFMRNMATEQRPKAVEAIKRLYKDKTWRKAQSKKISESAKRYYAEHPVEAAARLKASIEAFKRKAGGCYAKINKLEQHVLNVIQKYNLPYRYVGDFSFFVGDKSPDFVHLSDKAIVEVFGCWYHGCKKCYPNNVYRGPEERIETFAKHGYRCLIFWEHEIKNLTEEALVERIREAA